MGMRIGAIEVGREPSFHGNPMTGNHRCKIQPPTGTITQGGVQWNTLYLIPYLYQCVKIRGQDWNGSWNPLRSTKIRWLNKIHKDLSCQASNKYWATPNVLCKIHYQVTLKLLLIFFLGLCSLFWYSRAVDLQRNNQWSLFWGNI